jgi:hypothetical protein
MPRFIVFSAFVSLTLLTLLTLVTAAAQPDVVAQEATPGAATTHPFVGAWIVDTS